MDDEGAGDRLDEACHQVADALLQVIVEQNVALAGHLERVAQLAGGLAEALSQPATEIQLIGLAARLHDIGKAAIPGLILNKLSPLADADWMILRRIPVIGENVVLAAPALASTAPLIRSCHERIDGHGYPDRLAARDIPLGSRVIAVCDAFDVMTSLYGQPLGIEAALEELQRHAGTQFDATIVEAFCSTTSLHSRPDVKSHLSIADAIGA